MENPRVWARAMVLGLLILALARPAHATAQADGSHDFDFEIGTWRIQVQKLLHPLSGSHEWVTPRGYVHIVRKVWGGRASLAELEVLYPEPHYLGLMLRLYDPQARQWRIYWGDSSDASLDAPLTGAFANGRGEFVSRQSFDGKPVLVRVVYSDIRHDSFRTEQSFSSDSGKTWETNLIQLFTRERASLKNQTRSRRAQS